MAQKQKLIRSTQKMHKYFTMMLLCFFPKENASLQKNQSILTFTLISAGRGSQRTAGSPSRNRLPETSWCEAQAPALRQDGWMSCWKKRQKKWSSRGALSALQKALQDGGEERAPLARSERTSSIGEVRSYVKKKMSKSVSISHKTKHIIDKSCLQTLYLSILMP